MDRKLKSILFLLLVLIGLGSCKLYKKPSGPIIKECRIENDKAIITIDRKRIRYNEIKYVTVGAVCHPEKVEEIEKQLIITALTENIVDFKQGNTYDIEVYWFGGNIIASGIFNDNRFEIIEEGAFYY
ncbi:MAG: hypothetical protein MJ160_02215 [Treponema sp.]|nr:hypothetical protein [Treponema sp.]